MLKIHLHLNVVVVKSTLEDGACAPPPTAAGPARLFGTPELGNVGPVRGRRKGKWSREGVGSRGCVPVGRDELCHGFLGGLGHLGLFPSRDHTLLCSAHTNPPCTYAAGGTQSIAQGTQSMAGDQWR